LGEPVDWQFFVDFKNPSNANKPLTASDKIRLENIARLSHPLSETGHEDPKVWEALALELRAGQEQGIPDFRLEEYSGLRGQFMLDLIAGKLDIPDLIRNKPL
jgi:hypothetical protein